MSATDIDRLEIGDAVVSIGPPWSKSKKKGAKVYSGNRYGRIVDIKHRCKSNPDKDIVAAQVRGTWPNAKTQTILVTADQLDRHHS